MKPLTTRVQFFGLAVMLLLSGCSNQRHRLQSQTHEIPLQANWFIQSAAVSRVGGEVISRPDFKAKGWYHCQVPTTVLAALVANGVYSEPYYAKNLEKITTEPFHTSWWFRREFILPHLDSDTHAQLIFAGINYRANIWLNGGKIAASDEVCGAFRLFEFDVSAFLRRGKNTLAVEVFPPQPGEFTIGFVDWNPNPPDRNMGLFREVKLHLSGPVSIRHSFVQTLLTGAESEQAKLTIAAELLNHSDRTAAGVVQGKIEQLNFQQPFQLQPGEKKTIVFSPEQYPEMNIAKPRLWWPNNLGRAELYPLQLTVLAGKDFSDSEAINFGIRQVADYITPDGYRGYRINGKNLLLRGGGWVDDLLLVEDEKKLAAQFRLVRQMNLNTVRLEGFWGSSQKLYDLADRYGILLMPGWSCQWEWENYLGKPTDEFGGIQTEEDMSLVCQYLRDQVLWLRHHPSIFVWVLGSDTIPRPELEKRYDALLAAIDPSRPVLKGCSSRVSTSSGPTAVKMNGPYEYVTPNYWYEDSKIGGAFGFNTETGPGPVIPPLAAIQTMIPAEHMWPIDDYWDYHCARNEFASLKFFLKAYRQRYGEAKSAAEFAGQVQASNYEALRAMFEAFSVNRPRTTGIIQWMLNSAWPKLFWQLYDYSLLPTAAFYGTRKGAAPLVIAYHYGENAVYSATDAAVTLNAGQAEIQIYDLNSQKRFFKQIPVTLLANEAKKIANLPALPNITPVYFLALKLKDGQGNILADNFYWLSRQRDILDEKNSTWFYTPNRQYADFTALHQLPPTVLRVQLNSANDDGERLLRATLTNDSKRIAFFLELQVVGNNSGKPFLPVLWDDNYISLLPGESRTLSARFAPASLPGETPLFHFSGWNVKGQ